jgi:CSLREA domain-containing protein
VISASSSPTAPSLGFFATGVTTCPLSGCTTLGEPHSFVGSILTLYDDPDSLVPNDAMYTIDGSASPVSKVPSLSCTTGGNVRCSQGTFALNSFPYVTTPGAGNPTVELGSTFHNAQTGSAESFAASVTFEGGLTSPGPIAVSAQSDGPDVPDDFKTDFGPYQGLDIIRNTYYDVSTGASYDPPVVFCASFPAPLFAFEALECNVRLLHEDASCPDGWCDATIPSPLSPGCPLPGANCPDHCIDTDQNMVCARTDSFSFFVPALDVRPACSNGRDDDGDTLADYPADPHCASASDLTEAAPGPHIHVDTTADELNADGDCSLREAIRAANLDVAVDGCPAGSGPDDVLVPAGTFNLTIAGSGEDDSATGDLDLRSDIVLLGAGAGLTVLDASALGDRVLHVQPPAAGPDIQVGIHALTLRGGSVSLEGGGGIVIAESPGGDPTTTVEDCAIEDSFAAAGAGIGILHPEGGITTISRSLIRSNTASGGAGGIASIAASVSLLDSTVTGNISNATSCFGAPAFCAGGVYDGQSMTVRRSTISGNQSVHGPGGLGATQGSTTIGNSTISGNTTSSPGGGIRVDDSANLDLLFTTIKGNSSALQGGGVQAGPTGSVTIAATIVAGNAAATNPDVEGSFTSGGDNLIGKVGSATGFGGGDLVGTVASPIDPMLGPLAGNGGLTPSHAPLVGYVQSPAIDAADCIGVIQDQRAEPRPVGPRCDTGAYEFAPACADGLDNDGDGLVDHPADPGCQTALAASVENPACDYGVDNDGDSKLDHPEDPGCSAAYATSENPPPPSCGVGGELVFVLPALGLLRRRRLITR